jgi:ABC-type antimicrobial peptide transport system permease subunit
VVDSTQVVGGQFGQFPALQLGDPNIKPERNTEIEAGLDATFGKEFLNFSVTVYRKIITDLLLVQSLAPSTGYATRIFNAPGAQLSDKGIEIAAAVSPVRKPDVNWIIRGTFDLSRSNVDSLPVPAFNTLGFGTSLGAFRIEQGQSATQIVGSEGHVGDANPDFRAGLSSDLNYRQFSLGQMYFYIRSALPPDQMLRAIPVVMKKLDPNLPVEQLKTLPQQVRDNVSFDRMISVLSASFAILATLLAAVGLYGVLAYSVAQRTREIGVRMALGASSGNVGGMVLRQVGLMTVIGGVIGIAGALALGRGAQSLLYELKGSDPLVIAVAALLLTVVALGAGLVPALRASRVDPMQALRYE